MIVGCDGITCNEMAREKAYVDLAIIEEKQMKGQDWSKGDRDFHLRTNYFDKTSIRLEDLLTNSDHFVLVRGIAGVGKTSMMDSYVLKWAQGKLLNGKDCSDRIEFLFKLTCRNVNTFSDTSTAEKVLKTEFNTVFKYIDMDDLQDIAHRILILIDGMDELQSLHELTRKQKPAELPDLVRSMYELIGQNILTGHKTIIAARPEACQIIDGIFKGKIKIKMVEVCGFNPRSVNVYIDTYFTDKPDAAQNVKNRINESENLTIMASIPVYTWVICVIFEEDMNINTPQTTTHLFSYACLLFIRNHVKRRLPIPFPSNCSVLEIMHNTDVLQVIVYLAKLSQTTLKDKKVVFTENDLPLQNILIPLEHTGFIVKNQRKNIYQFRHLVLQ